MRDAQSPSALRRTALLCLGTVSCLGSLGTAGCVPRGEARPVRAEEHATSEVRASVGSARELDQEGVRSFRAGRFTDAMAYFRAARRLGGPSSELWNIVRCREGMDDAEGAVEAIDEYLAAKDLAPQDRADAEREEQGLRSRASFLTVLTTPSGAVVSVDGRPVAGTTPTSLEIRAGAHSVSVRRAGYAPATQTVDARLGRAVIVSLDLERAGK